MQRYLAFLLWPEGGVIRQEEFSCEDDAAAVERAKAMATEHHVELWEPESPRRIARFDPARMGTAN